MATGITARLHNTGVRRAITIPAVGAAACVLSTTVAAWAPAALTVDLLERRPSLPRVRALTFATAWAWLESLGIAASSTLWVAGRAHDQRANYALQRWWAARLVDALRATINLQIDVDGLARLSPGPIVMCARHAGIADSLLPAWLLGQLGMRPRYVLKDDLAIDPCLDIVGHRLPNHFVDRDPEDSTAELRELERLAHGMSRRDAAVIFPEGAVMTDTRRSRAIATIEADDPVRAVRMRTLRRLGPVRPGGTAALLRGAPDADIVFVDHTGLEALDRIAGAPGGIPLAAPARVHITRVPRRRVPVDEFTAWFDDQWARIDRRLPADSGHGARR